MLGGYLSTTQQVRLTMTRIGHHAHLLLLGHWSWDLYPETNLVVPVRTMAAVSIAYSEVPLALELGLAVRVQAPPCPPHLAFRELIRARQPTLLMHPCRQSNESYIAACREGTRGLRMNAIRDEFRHA